MTEDSDLATHLAADLRGTVRGDVWLDPASRAVYATDSSNYRVVPMAVVCPLDEADVRAALEVCAAHDVPVTPRGAGTSLAGQAVGRGLILDTSRHMRRIVDIDPERRIARVEPGVVLDDLRREAEVHGLTFGPDPATHAWCTLGGMLGNNACGTHGLVAGLTSDNVERLRVVRDGGGVVEAAPGEVLDGEGRPHEELGSALRRIVEASGDAIRRGYPSLARRVSGYGLDDLLPERGFHVARALVGTEGTCAVITEATLKLVHIPSRRRLIVLPYPDVFAAADAVPRLLEDAPIGLEGFDETLVRLMRARPLHLEHLALLPDGGAWLYAEVAGDTDSEADEAAAAFTARLPAGQAWRRFDDPASQAKLWLIRESGLGATALRPDGTHNLEGWEDAAVPPERLGEYLRSLTALWREFGYSGAYYGHFGQGCVHTRNDFDLHSVDGLARFRAYAERAADLVVGLGGSLSGEHGDGRARGELLGRMYGDELLDAFRAFRAAWDPRGRMNPGVLVDADPLDANLRRGPTYRTSSLPGTVPADGLALARDRGSLQAAAERCVGVGRCRREDAGVMCPSFRATGLEVHSTRGRAKVLAELFQGEITPETWHNDDVRGALDLCLSCKGCAVDCPTGVDMAAYKAEFLHRYYRRRPRPAAALLLGLVPLWARAATRAPRAANAVVALPGIGRVGRRLAGVTARRPVPTFADRPLRRRAEIRRRSRQVDPTVVVWPDTFSDAFRPAAATDVVAVLEAAGDRVAIPTDWACCGRPLYDSGMLSLARSWLGRLVGVLDPWTSRGVPVVVPEPSCLAAFRDELPALLPDDPRATRLAGLARSPAEHLLASGGVDRLRARINGPRGTDRLAIHPHCHARASGAAAADEALATALGFDATVVDGGCCGLAGSFGFRREHEALSRTIGEQGWLPALDRASEGRRVVIDGFSCALQLEHLRGGGSTPLMRVVLEAIDGAAPPQGSGA